MDGLINALVIVGLLLVGWSVWELAGVVGITAYAGMICIVMAVTLELAARRRGSR